MLKALQNLFPSLGATGDPATEFYNKFQRAADDHDQGFIKRYDDDLNTTLIFVSVFPARPNIGANPVFGIGWFVLCGDIRFHNRRSKQA